MPRSTLPPARSGSKGQGHLRIIAGEWRSRRLAVPEGEGLRPTPDRVRETLFNWLAPYIEGARVLDAFTGSGALVLEALSRGAEDAVALDSNPAAIANLKNNLEILRCPAGRSANRRPALPARPGQAAVRWCSSTRRSTRTCWPTPATCWSSASGWRAGVDLHRKRSGASTCRCPATGACTARRNRPGALRAVATITRRVG
jgi:hypothetical protein